jgi:hypothetical protein
MNDVDIPLRAGMAPIHLPHVTVWTLAKVSRRPELLRRTSRAPPVASTVFFTFETRPKSPYFPRFHDPHFLAPQSRLNHKLCRPDDPALLAFVAEFLRRRAHDGLPAFGWTVPIVTREYDLSEGQGSANPGLLRSVEGIVVISNAQVYQRLPNGTEWSGFPEDRELNAKQVISLQRLAGPEGLSKSTGSSFAR